MPFSMSADDDSVRRRFTADEIRSFLPGRGAFMFPDPYQSQGVRLTSDEDGAIEPVGYSYWNNINNHAGQSSLLVFVGRSVAPPLLFAVDKGTLAVAKLGELPLRGTGERWRFSHTHPSRIYAEEVDSRLLRLDVWSGTPEVVFDLADHGYPGHILWQSHTSADDNVHSATLKSPDYQPLGAVVFRESDGRFGFFPGEGAYDECQIDKSGRFLVIKEGSDNRIIDLEGGETLLVNNAGALGHSDCGFGYMVGEDDMYVVPGAMRCWQLEPMGNVSDGRLVYRMHGWDAMARHVAHGNARPESADGQHVIVSSAHRADLPRANEIVRATLDGSLECQVLAPNLVDLDAPSGGDDYRKLPKANIDPTGEWVCWSANCGTERLDVFLVRTT